jgi:drug/metabolite transporter (DMT)-like permease
MNSFLIALANPLFHALANHLDKYIISRYLKHSSVGALVLITSLFSVVALPIIFVLNPGVLNSIPFNNIVILAINGGFLVLAMTFYFYALKEDEASLVAPFFQLVPVFGFFLGYFILGETLLKNQIAGALLIAIGGAFLSVYFSGHKIKFRKRLTLLMLGSSLLYSANAVIFKSIAQHQGFLDSLFWDMLGKCIFGGVLFIFATSFRKDLIRLIKVNNFSVIGYLFLAETFTLIGEVALIFAVLSAPVALIQSIGGLQPLFVLIIGVFITLFLPKFGKESLQRNDILQKSIGVSIITVGVYFLSF